MTQDDFFEGLSLPRNKEIMRIYKDLDMVEPLGSGVSRILQAYDKSCFKFADNLLRMTLPRSVVESEQDVKVVTSQDTDQDADQVTPQDKALDNSGYIDVIPQVTPQVKSCL